MKAQRYIFLVALVGALAPGVDAQVMAMSAGPIPPESVGVPAEPPLLTLLGIVNPGKLATDPSIPPKGRVSEVLHEELRGRTLPAGRAGEVEASVRTKFDNQGRVTERIEKRWGGETDTVYAYRDGRLVSIESTVPGAKKPTPKAWNYWTYDSQGKVTEYQRGRGSSIENHELGFQYDSQGRLLALDYRQGANDQPFSHTQISYSNDGRTVIVTKTFTGTKIVDRSTRVLDDQGRVVQVKFASEGREPNDQAKNVVFRYDGKGRLVEQTTDATKFSQSGAELDLPPGTISIVYDDKAHTKRTKYSFPGEGSIEAVVTQDDDGNTIGFALKGGPQEFTSKLDCEYDRFGNWTSCRQTVEGQRQKFVKEQFRRTITYR